MLTLQERKIILYISNLWTGPNTWGWYKGYRLSLKETLQKPEFG